MRAWGALGQPRVGRAGVGGAWRAVPWAGGEHAIVDRLVSVVFRFEFEGLAGQSESDVDPSPTDRPIRCHIDPTERSSDAFQLIRRAAGDRKSDRRTDNVT